MSQENEFIPGAMGDRIAYLRKRKKLTQAQLAQQLGISAQAVSKWESGLSCPDIMTLVPLAQVLGVSTDELLGVQGGGANRMSGEGFGEVYEESPDIEEAVNTKAGDHKGSDEEAGFEERTGYRSLLVIPAEDEGAHAIRQLTVGAGACAAVIKNGSDFGLEMEGYQEGEIISEVSEGVWKIRDIADKNLLLIGRNSFSKKKMVITVPKWYHFDSVNLSIGAGTLNGEGIHTDKSVLSVGAGQITMTDFRSGASKITCGMGEIIVRGELHGKCTVDCGMGSVRLYIRELEHYGYRTSVGMGEVRIGENKLSGIGGSQTMNAGDPNFFKVSCSMGMVSVAFSEENA